MSTQDIPLILLPAKLAVSRLSPVAQLPGWAASGDLLAYVYTHEELSVVCEERFVPPEITSERGWRALKVQGPLDFSLVGVLASIAAPLAEANVSIFAISTYNTDYILFPEKMLSPALQALTQAGFLISGPVDG